MFIVYTDKSDEKKAALLTDTHDISELALWRPDDLNFNDVVNITITAKAPTNTGWFAKTDTGISLYITAGTPVFVGMKARALITKEARKGKEAAGILTEKDITITPNLVARLTAQAALWEHSSAQVIPCDTSWSADEWLAAFEQALSPTVMFSNGACLHIGRTDVCWTIDVDSGNSDTDFKALNDQAIAPIIRHIRLKNMSGVILVDFIGSKPHFFREKALKTVTEYLKKDPRVTDINFTHSGLLEIVRKRETASLADKLLTPDGQHFSEITLAYFIIDRLKESKKAMPTVRATPALIEILRRKYTKAIYRPVLNQPIDFFEIIE